MPPPTAGPEDASKPLAAARQRLYNGVQQRVHAEYNAAQQAAARERMAKARAAKAALKAAVAAGTVDRAHTVYGPPSPVPKQGRRVTADLAVGMMAAGLSRTATAKALHVNPQQVSRALTAVPGSRERLAVLREELKDLKLTRAHAVEGKVWDRFEAEVASGEAKDVDGVARALLALEKIQAAAAGEAHASGAPEPGAAPMELSVLVQALLSAPSPPA